MAKTRGQYHLTAFDPGSRATGWAAFSLPKTVFVDPELDVIDNIRWWGTGEFTGSEYEIVEQCLDLVKRARFGPMPFMAHTDVVSEDFDLVQTLGGKELLSPVRINAMLGYGLWLNGVKLNLQSRVMRTNVTRARLRRWGFKATGKDSFAALQHGLTWLRRVKQESIKKPWKLTEEEHEALSSG